LRNRDEDEESKMSGDENDPTSNPYDEAGQQAAKGAGDAVPVDAGADAAADLNAQMIKIKRMIAGSPKLQATFSDVQNDDELHQKIVQISADHGVTITPEQSKAFLTARGALQDQEVPDPPPTSQGHTCESGCTYNPYDSACSYPPHG
jgi:hypothetical protein